jgi:phosphocarrier protein
MKTVACRITSEWGIHARPAGRLAKFASQYACEIWVGTPGRMVRAKNILSVMGLDLKQGDEVTLVFDGPDETAALAAAPGFLRENL